MNCFMEIIIHIQLKVVLHDIALFLRTIILDKNKNVYINKSLENNALILKKYFSKQYDPIS